MSETEEQPMDLQEQPRNNRWDEEEIQIKNFLNNLSSDLEVSFIQTRLDRGVREDEIQYEFELAVKEILEKEQQLKLSLELAYVLLEKVQEQRDTFAQESEQFHEQKEELMMEIEFKDQYCEEYQRRLQFLTDQNTALHKDYVTIEEFNEQLRARNAVLDQELLQSLQNIETFKQVREDDMNSKLNIIDKELQSLKAHNTQLSKDLSEHKKRATQEQALMQEYLQVIDEQNRTLSQLQKESDSYLRVAQESQIRMQTIFEEKEFLEMEISRLSIALNSKKLIRQNSRESDSQGAQEIQDQAALHSKYPRSLSFNGTQNDPNVQEAAAQAEKDTETKFTEIYGEVLENQRRSKANSSQIDKIGDEMFNYTSSNIDSHTEDATSTNSIGFHRPNPKVPPLLLPSTKNSNRSLQNQQKWNQQPQQQIPLPPQQNPSQFSQQTTSEQQQQNPPNPKARVPPKPKRRPPQVKQLELDESDGSEELNRNIKGVQSKEGYLLEDDSERETNQNFQTTKDPSAATAPQFNKPRKITQEIKLNSNEDLPTDSEVNQTDTNELPNNQQQNTTKTPAFTPTIGSTNSAIATSTAAAATSSSILVETNQISEAEDDEEEEEKLDTLKQGETEIFVLPQKPSQSATIGPLLPSTKNSNNNSTGIYESPDLTRKALQKSSTTLAAASRGKSKIFIFPSGIETPSSSAASRKSNFHLMSSFNITPTAAALSSAGGGPRSAMTTPQAGSMPKKDLLNSANSSSAAATNPLNLSNGLKRSRIKGVDPVDEAQEELMEASTLPGEATTTTAQLTAGTTQQSSFTNPIYPFTKNSGTKELNQTKHRKSVLLENMKIYQISHWGNDASSPLDLISTTPTGKDSNHLFECEGSLNYSNTSPQDHLFSQNNRVQPAPASRPRRRSLKLQMQQIETSNGGVIGAAGIAQPKYPMTTMNRYCYPSTFGHPTNGGTTPSASGANMRSTNPFSKLVISNQAFEDQNGFNEHSQQHPYRSGDSFNGGSPLKEPETHQMHDSLDQAYIQSVDDQPITFRTMTSGAAHENIQTSAATVARAREASVTTDSEDRSNRKPNSSQNIVEQILRSGLKASAINRESFIDDSESKSNHGERIERTYSTRLRQPSSVKRTPPPQSSHSHQPPKRDPYEDFFMLTAQCVKLNSPYFDEVISFNVQPYYQKAKQQQIPYHKWEEFIQKEIDEQRFKHINSNQIKKLFKIKLDTDKSASGINVTVASIVHSQVVSTVNSRRNSFKQSTKA